MFTQISPRIALALAVGIASPLAAQDFQSPSVQPYQAYPVYQPMPAVAVLSPQTATIQSATQVLTDVTAMPEGGIPGNLMANAHALAIIPGVIKVGFIAGVRHGHGVILVRDAKGAWSAPQFVSLTGGSIGFQAGAQSTDVVLVFKNPETVAAMLRGKITLGADAAVAAGPVGRQAQAATDLQLKAEIFSYSRSRGLFAGVSLDGASLKTNAEETTAYYAAGVPEASLQLVELVTKLSQAGAPQPAMEGGAQLVPVPSEPVIEAPGVVLEEPNMVPVQVPSALQQLGGSWQNLAGKLDDQWRNYLALPPAVFNPGGAPSVESLAKSLQNYETVAGNPQFRVLAEMPEFQATLQLLRSSIVERVNAPVTGPGPPMLPPPPRQ